MGAGNISIVGQPGTLVAPDRESQIQLLLTQGMTRSKAEYVLDRKWDDSDPTAPKTNIDAGYTKEGVMAVRPDMNEYGKKIPLGDTILAPTGGKPLRNM